MEKLPDIGKPGVAEERSQMRRLPLTRGMADATLAPDDTGAFVDAPFVRFDWLWPLVRNGNGAIHGMKIDVQGMELDVLDGMRETLRRWRPRVVIELHSGVSRERILGLLNEAGYSREAVAIDPADGEGPARLLDDRSYAFNPA